MNVAERVADTKSIRGWLFLGSLLLSVQVAAAATLQCKFSDDEGKPLKNVEARLTLTGTEQHQFERSGKNGEAGFHDVKAGEYELMAQLKGYVTLKREIEIVADQSIEQTLMSEKAFDRLDEEVRGAIRNEQFSSALPTVQKLLISYPQDAALHFNLGLIYAGLQQQDKATAEAEKAAKLDAEFAEKGKLVQGTYWRERGQNALKKEDFAIAAEAFENWTKLDATSDQAFYGLALAYGHQGKYPQALAAVDKALQLAPQNESYQKVKQILQTNASQ